MLLLLVFLGFSSVFLRWQRFDIIFATVIGSFNLLSIFRFFFSPFCFCFVKLIFLASSLRRYCCGLRQKHHRFVLVSVSISFHPVLLLFFPSFCMAFFFIPFFCMSLFPKLCLGLACFCFPFVSRSLASSPSGVPLEPGFVPSLFCGVSLKCSLRHACCRVRPLHPCLRSICIMLALASALLVLMPLLALWENRL